jgi:hypothetical protein
MANEKVQNFQNHARLFPPFHFFVLPVLMINAIYRLVLLKNGISFASIMAALLGLALFMLAFCARVFANTVQDRVIRLEMQLRLARLLPADLRPRIDEFTVGQLIALRFAGDDELPALARQVLDEKVADRKAIKSRVKQWRPDYLRC